MVQDANKLVVFGSQLVGVIIVIVGVLTQQAKLHSPRPTSGKAQITSEAAQGGDHFARLWDDPLEDLSSFESVAPKLFPATALPTTATPSPSSTKEAPKRLLIWNVLDARAAPEIRERRLRTRYAIASRHF
jgi:hypothetical protein